MNKLIVVSLITNSVLVQISSILLPDSGIARTINIDSSTAYLLDMSGQSVTNIKFEKQLDKIVL